jgi:hypothetical protein
MIDYKNQLARQVGLKPTTLRLAAISSPVAGIVPENPPRNARAVPPRSDLGPFPVSGVNLVSNPADCAGFAGHTGS